MIVGRTSRDAGLNGGLMVPDAKYDIQLRRIQEVDLLCSMWFLERDWVRHLFTEVRVRVRACSEQ